MTSTTAQRWIASVEQGVARALEKTARAKPLKVELEAAPFLATFKRQAATFHASALESEAAGDRMRARYHARQAERAATNHARVTAALESLRS